MSDANFHQFYLEEPAHEPEMTVVSSVRLPLSTIQMIDALAIFFNSSRSFIIQTILAKEAGVVIARITDEGTKPTVKAMHDALTEAREKLMPKIEYEDK